MTFTPSLVNSGITTLIRQSSGVSNGGTHIVVVAVVVVFLSAAILDVPAQ